MSKIRSELLARCIGDLYSDAELLQYLEPLENDPNYTIKQMIALVEREDLDSCVMKIILDFTDLHGRNAGVPNFVATYVWDKLSKHVSAMDAQNTRSVRRFQFFGP